MKRKICFLLISFFIFVSYLFIKNMYVDSISLSTNIISIDEKTQIMNDRNEYDGEIDLYYKGEKIPYVSKDNYYLLSMMINESFYSNISNIINTEKFRLNLISMSGSNFSIIAYNDKFYKVLDVEVTSLPVIVIGDNNIGISDIYTNMVLFEPSYSNTYVESFDIYYRIKGESSLINDKKSFRVNVVDSNMSKRNVSLLGMDYDDDWVLNSMSFDKSLIREKISYDIWNSLSDDYQHQMEYVEVVIDNDYRGLYCLQEIVDLNTFDADEDDLLVSIKIYPEDIFNSKIDNLNYKLDSDIVDEFEIEKGLDDNSLRLELLRSFKKSLEDLRSNVDIKYDFDNSANYSLFINLILAFDNTHKNEKILFRDDGSYYTLIKSPWDLDYTFNNEVMSANISFDTWLVDTAIPESIRTDANFYNLMKEKYIEIRKSVYNEEYLYNLIDKYETILISSGALERNSNRWDNFYSGTDVMKKFIADRILFLDNYFGGISNEL